jgi:hypothetical protein
VRARQRAGVAVALLALSMVMAACQAGQNGGDALGFIRGGALWRVQPDGSGLYQITPGTVIGFAWSPDHHQLVARYAAITPAPAAAPFYPNTVPDAPAALGVVSIDGGNILPITPSGTIPVRSDAWWDANGNRLFYRESGDGRVQWILSQADQPNGIARKPLGASLATPMAPLGGDVPTSAPDGSQVAWVTDGGDLVLGTPGGATPHVLARNALVQLANGAPARALWQPDHNAILFAGGSAAQVTLLVSDLSGKTQQIAQGPFDGYAWSPDGAHILVHQPGQWTIYTSGGASAMMWNDTIAGGVPWWSPDGRAVLVIAPTALTLVTLATKSTQTLATFTATNAMLPAPGGPLSSSPWSSDSQSFALVTRGGTWHDHTALATHTTAGTGLYIIAIGALAHAPRLIDWGDHQALSWSTPDPNTLWVAP